MSGGGTPNDDFAGAIARYSRSCDEMRTFRLNPLKAMPIDQYPEETQVRAGVVVRAKNLEKYMRYLLQITAENERLAEQARKWWAWWEMAQVEPSKAGAAPLVDPRIDGPLKVAAAHRAFQAARDLAGKGGEQKKPKRRKAGGTRRRSELDMKACAAVATLEDRRVAWKPIDVARLLGIKDSRSLTGTKPDPSGRGRVDRCPGFMRLWSKQKHLK